MTRLHKRFSESVRATAITSCGCRKVLVKIKNFQVTFDSNKEFIRDNRIGVALPKSITSKWHFRKIAMGFSTIHNIQAIGEAKEVDPWRGHRTNQ